MKLNPNSTPQQISEQPWVDCPDGFCSPHQQAMLTQSRTFEFKTMSPDGYPKYINYVDDPYYDLVAPNPPTPEMVKRAKFVDKTYQWKSK